MKQKRLIIDIQFGSDFQEDVWGQLLVSILAAFTSIMETKHKDNKMDVKQVSPEIMGRRDI